MNKPSLSTLLTRETIDDRRYYESLLHSARSLRLADDRFLQDQQTQFRNLLFLKARSFTGGECTSLSRNRMEYLAQSIRFALGFRLRAEPEPLCALALLKNNSLENLHAEGVDEIRSAVRSAEIFHQYMKGQWLNLRNACLRSTFLEGIPAFFRLYNPEYGAHERHITADYPVMQDPAGYSGIDFIRKYLDALNLENRFLRMTEPNRIRHILALYALRSGIEPGDLCENLFQIVLACTILPFQTGELPVCTEIAANHLLNRFYCRSDSLRNYVLATCRQDPAALIRIQRLITGGKEKLPDSSPSGES